MPSNKELKLTKPDNFGASELNSSVGRTLEKWAQRPTLVGQPSRQAARIV